MRWLRRVVCGWTDWTEHCVVLTPRGSHAFTTECVICGEQRWGVGAARGTLPMTADVEAMFRRHEAEKPR